MRFRALMTLAFVFLAQQLVYAEVCEEPKPYYIAANPGMTVTGYWNPKCPVGTPPGGYISPEQAYSCGTLTSCVPWTGGKCYPRLVNCSPLADGEGGIYGYFCAGYYVPESGIPVLMHTGDVYRLYAPSTSGCPNGYILEGNSCRIKEITDVDAGLSGSGFDIVRDTNGNVTRVTDPDGNITRVEGYDTYGRPTTVIRPNGDVDTYTYYGKSNNVATATKNGTRTTTFTWYEPGQPAKITTPDGTSWTFEYNSDGVTIGSSPVTAVKVKTAGGGGAPGTWVKPGDLPGASTIYAQVQMTHIALNGQYQVAPGLPVVYRMLPLLGIPMLVESGKNLPSLSLPEPLANTLHTLFPMIPIVGYDPLKAIAPMASICMSDTDKPDEWPKLGPNGEKLWPGVGTKDRSIVCWKVLQRNTNRCYEMHYTNDKDLGKCLGEAAAEYSRCVLGESEPRDIFPKPHSVQ